jgi:phosphomevalonate kinase
MQKIEKWRVQELVLVLEEISIILKKGKNTEWANVFSHYHFEAQKILESRILQVDKLNQLIRNIKNCFHSGSSLDNPLIFEDMEKEFYVILQEFQSIRLRLLGIIRQMEDQLIEFIH